MTARKLAQVDRRLMAGVAGLAGVVLGWALLPTVLADAGDGGPGMPAPSGAPPGASRTPLPPRPPVNGVPPRRDPFSPTVRAPSTPAAGPATVPATPAPAPTTAPPTTSPLPANAQAALELKAIGSDGSGTVRATITVDGTAYRPAKGEVFSYGYRLENIVGNCVDVTAQVARAHMCLK